MVGSVGVCDHDDGRVGGRVGEHLRGKGGEEAGRDVLKEEK